MPTYEQISEADMDSAVAAFKRGPDRRSLNPAQETTYDWSLGARNTVGPKLAVRLYSSVVPAAGAARACGEDAIRVAVVASPGTRSERLVLTLRRVHRTPGWAARMRQRLTDAWVLIRRSPPCPACGGYTVPRAVRPKDADGKPDRRARAKRFFWGCSRGNCSGAASAAKVPDGKGGWRPPKTLDEVLAGLAPAKPAKLASAPVAPPQEVTR